MKRLILHVNFFSALLLPSFSSAAEYAITQVPPSLSTAVALNNLGHIAEAQVWYDEFGVHFSGLSYASAITDNGKISGTIGSGANAHAALFDGTLHDLGTLGGTFSRANDVNNSGQVVGLSKLIGNVAFEYHAFFYDGSLHELGTFGGTESEATGINDDGLVTGWASTADNRRHGFIYDGNTLQDIGNLGVDFVVEPQAINHAGEVAGSTFVPDDGGRHVFLYDGTMHDIGKLGDHSYAYDINDDGQIIGNYQLETPVEDIYFHALLYDHDHGLVDLNSLIDPLSGWALTDAYSINNAGQILGAGYLDGQYLNFLLTPVPEPPTLVLTGLGIGGRYSGGSK